MVKIDLFEDSISVCYIYVGLGAINEIRQILCIHFLLSNIKLGEGIIKFYLGLASWRCRLHSIAVNLQKISDGIAAFGMKP